MIVQIVNKSDFELPAYATEGSAGMDLRADLKRYYEQNDIDCDPNEAPLTIKPFEVYKIPTGIFIAPPKVKTKYPTGSMAPMICDETDQEYETQIRPRSGLAAKHGITLMNSVGTVDSDFRNEICILLIKLTLGEYTIKHGERIAQMVFNRVEKVTWNVVEQLDETTRGMGGFGSTGNK